MRRWTLSFIPSLGSVGSNFLITGKKSCRENIFSRLYSLAYKSLNTGCHSKMRTNNINKRTDYTSLTLVDVKGGVLFMKKTIMSLVLIMVLVLVAGCLNYKTYDASKDAVSDEDTSLVDEIAQIEEELAREEGATASDELTGGAVAEPSEEAADELPEDLEEDATLPDLEEAETVETEIDGEVETETTDTFPAGDDLDVVRVKENELIKLKVAISDPDKDPVTYTFSKPLNKDGEWKTNYGDAGEYVVTIIASDGKLTTEKKVRLAVERVNVPPVVEGIAPISVQEGNTVKFQPKVSDPNRDKVTVTVSKPLDTGAWETDHTSAGEYQIKVVASDGELETEKSFTLKVADVNVPPEVTNLKDLVVKEGDVVRIEPKIMDLDEDKVSVTISDPVGNDGIWETAFTDHGEYFMTITADDGKDKVTKRVRVLVEDVNMPPQIVDIALE